jgi:uncharacterized protein (TIGR00251 family)
MVEFRQKDNGVLFFVRVQPRSSKSRICGEYNGSIKINLRSAPVDDAANRECCELIAKTFCIPPSRVSVVSGRASRSKTLKIEGISPQDAETALASYL